MQKNLVVSIICGLALSLSAQTVAVFPVQGVNTDKSFSDAFGQLLAHKYEDISGATVINPLRAAKALGADSNYVSAAAALNASEYLEISAVGLYVSKKELKEFESAEKIVVNVNDDDDDDDEDEEDNDKDDQQLLDNSKTIVTVYRKASSGATLHKSELTLLTYGDIEESTERIALSLFKKISVNEVRSQTNITRREGMGNNRLFVLKAKGIRMGMAYPTTFDVDTLDISPFFTISYDFRMISEKFFLELCAGARIPSQVGQTDKRQIGGMNIEMGGSYFLRNDIAGIYVGGGLNPYIDVLNETQLGVAIFAKTGVMMPQNSRMKFYIDLKVAQNVLPIVTGREADTTDSYYSYEEPDVYPSPHRGLPTELGLDFGIAW
jgi:hypothetical protein